MEIEISQLRIRKVARAIVLNDFDEILLINHVDTTPANPQTPEILSYWVPPGGGVEEGEIYEEAAMRELWEETGIEVQSVERCILTRDADLMFAGELVAQQDRFFLSRVAGRPSLSQFAPNEGIVEAQWWPITEIANSSEHFFPEGIAELIREELGRVDSDKQDHFREDWSWMGMSAIQRLDARDEAEEERGEWTRFALTNFAHRYENEPDIYTEDMITEPNPNYHDP